jgi:hypothetical protein
MNNQPGLMAQGTESFREKAQIPVPKKPTGFHREFRVQ